MSGALYLRFWTRIHAIKRRSTVVCDKQSLQSPCCLEKAL